ncbi:neck protein [Anopheles sinensis]|uniref:Neck protein n=1 Tax=Anopheles sinensis TaxID=74873 RepID=A0A084WS51_ANOSI|nr:neck protein [Anopheles sinensis]
MCSWFFCTTDERHQEVGSGWNSFWRRATSSGNLVRRWSAERLKIAPETGFKLGGGVAQGFIGGGSETIFPGWRLDRTGAKDRRDRTPGRLQSGVRCSYVRRVEARVQECNPHPHRCSQLQPDGGAFLKAEDEET